MVPPSRPGRPVGAYVTFALSVLGGLALIGLVIHLLSGPADFSGCDSGQVVPAPLNFVFLIGCIGAFAIGGLVTRKTRPPSPTALGRAGTPRRTILQVVLILVLLTLAVLLGYEAWSLSPLNSRSAEFWPITYFVRCASRSGWLAALPIVIAMSGFFGKWLWYRPGLDAT
jgi:hypothetical protein